MGIKFIKTGDLDTDAIGKEFGFLSVVDAAGEAMRAVFVLDDGGGFVELKENRLIYKSAIQPGEYKIRVKAMFVALQQMHVPMPGVTTVIPTEDPTGDDAKPNGHRIIEDPTGLYVVHSGVLVPKIAIISVETSFVTPSKEIIIRIIGNPNPPKKSRNRR